MKKICIVITFFLLLFSQTNAAILKYEDTVRKDENFSEFWLLENYLQTHKKKIQNFQQKYEIYDNIQLNNYLDELNQLEKLAKQIYNSKELQYDRKEVSEKIVNKIKNINLELKEILVYEKEKFEKNLIKKQKAYSIIGKQIWDKIYQRIEEQVEIVKNSQLEKETKIKIVVHLRNLEKNAIILKNFWNKTYNNEKEMKESFINTFHSIKQDLRSINNLLK